MLCRRCDKPFERRPNEAPAKYRKRQFCSVTCSNTPQGRSPVVLTPEQIVDIRERYADGLTSQAQIARAFGVSEAAISRLCADVVRCD